jgi:hypothetical protein
MPKAVALGDFTGMNFSQSRLALALAEDTAEPIRELFAHSCVLWPYERFCERRGYIDPDYMAVHVQGPAMLSANPREEILADILRVSNNMGTLEDVLAKYGKAYTPTMEQREIEVDDQIQRNIMPMATPGAKPIGPGGSDETDDDRPARE